MINEEITDREFNIGMRIGSITYNSIKNTINFLITQLSKNKTSKETQQKNPDLKHGKQTYEELKKHNEGLTPIELKDPNLRLLNNEMNKSKIDFAISKDGKGKYILRFKGNDKAELLLALKKYIKKLKSKDITKPSIAKALTNAKAVAKALSKQEKVKNRSKGAR